MEKERKWMLTEIPPQKWVSFTLDSPYITREPPIHEWVEFELVHVVGCETILKVKD